MYRIFNITETRYDKRNLIADLDSAPESYPKTLFRLSDTKFLLDTDQSLKACIKTSKLK